MSGCGLGVFIMTHLSEGSIKYVHWAVVRGVPHVLDIVLHLHLHRVAIVVLTTLELLVPVLSRQSLQKCRNEIRNHYCRLTYNTIY